VHPTSVGNREVAEAPLETADTEDIVTVRRWMLDSEPPPMWKAALGKPGRVDRWQLITFHAPCTVSIDVGVALAGTGAPQGDRSQGITGHIINTVTPETNHSVWSFSNFVRNYRIEDQRLTHQIAEGTLAILMEDKHILEIQQAYMDENPDREFKNLSIDAGSVRVRRILLRMIAAEEQAASAGVKLHRSTNVV
jgi:vanillate O-demethylase monooxygenase subunit